jgi:hypothetical protein
MYLFTYLFVYKVIYLLGNYTTGITGQNKKVLSLVLHIHLCFMSCNNFLYDELFFEI